MTKYPKEICRYKAMIEGYENDWKKYQVFSDNVEGWQGLEIKGHPVTDPESAGTYILSCTEKVMCGTDVFIGTYCGFRLSALFDPFSQKIQLKLQGDSSYLIDIRKKAKSNIVRLKQCLEGIPEYIAKAQEMLDQIYHQQDSAQKELETSFPFEDDLKEKSQRLDELNCELNLESVPLEGAEKNIDEAVIGTPMIKKAI